MTVLLWPESVPPKAPEVQKQTAKETAVFLASADFDKLDINSRQNYMEKVLADTAQHADIWAARKVLSDDQRKRLEQNMRPVFKKMIETRIDHYFTLPEEQREDYLDELIDQAMALRDNWEKIRKNDPPDAKYRRHRKNRGQHGPPQMRSQQGFQKFLAKTTPQERSKLIRFSLAAVKRLNERGLLPKK